MQADTERLHSNKQVQEGWVYVVTTKSLPNLIKVGYTTQPDINRQLEEINQAGLPYPYEIAYKAWVPEPQGLAHNIHQVLDTWRENGEWFRCSVARAQYALELLTPGLSVQPAPETSGSSGSAWSGYSEEPNAPRPRKREQKWEHRSLIVLGGLALLGLVHIGLAVGFPSKADEPQAYNVCLQDGVMTFHRGATCLRGRHLGQIRQTTASQRDILQIKEWELDMHLRHFLRIDTLPRHRGFDSSRQAMQFVKSKHMTRRR